MPDHVRSLSVSKVVVGRISSRLWYLAQANSQDTHSTLMQALRDPGVQTKVQRVRVLKGILEHALAQRWL